MPQPQIDQDIATLAGALGVSAEALLGRSRTADLATRRAIAYRLLLECGHPGPLVAYVFGRDHSTIYQMRGRATIQAAASPLVRALTRDARRALKEAPDAQ